MKVVSKTLDSPFSRRDRRILQLSPIDHYTPILHIISVIENNSVILVINEGDSLHYCQSASP